MYLTYRLLFPQPIPFYLRLLNSIVMICRMPTSPYPSAGYPPFPGYSYPGATGTSQVPAMPAMPAMPAIPQMQAIPGMPQQVPPTPPQPSTPSSKLVYGRTDLSMEEWRATLPKYRYQDFIADARVRNM